MDRAFITGSPELGAAGRGRGPLRGTRCMLRRNDLLLGADLGGTFLFGIEGALAVIQGHLDLLGVMVLSFAAALAGGIIRDVLIGDAPPNAIRDWRYAAIAFGGGAATCVLYPLARHMPADLLIVLDAAALALFAIAGTQKAVLHGVKPLIAALMGTVTAVGGGVVRDVLLAQVPGVLRTDIYATAALAGSVAMLCGRRMGLSAETSSAIGGVLCFALRLVSVWQHWRLPTVGALWA